MAYATALSPWAGLVSGFIEGREKATEDARKTKQQADAEKQAAIQRANLNLTMGNYQGAESDLRAGLGEEGDWSSVVAKYKERVEREAMADRAKELWPIFKDAPVEVQQAIWPTMQANVPELAGVEFGSFGKSKVNLGDQASIIRAVEEGLSTGLLTETQAIAQLKQLPEYIPQTRQVPAFGQVPAETFVTQTNPSDLKGGIPSVFDPATRRAFSTADAQALAAQPVMMQTGTRDEEYLPPMTPKATAARKASYRDSHNDPATGRVVQRYVYEDTSEPAPPPPGMTQNRFKPAAPEKPDKPDKPNYVWVTKRRPDGTTFQERVLDQGGLKSEPQPLAWVETVDEQGRPLRVRVGDQPGLKSDISASRTYSLEGVPVQQLQAEVAKLKKALDKYEIWEEPKRESAKADLANYQAEIARRGTGVPAPVATPSATVTPAPAQRKEVKPAGTTAKPPAQRKEVKPAGTTAKPPAAKRTVKNPQADIFERAVKDSGF